MRFIKRKKHLSVALLVGAVFLFAKVVGSMAEDAFVGYLNQKVADKWKEVYPLCKQYIPIITQWIFPALVASVSAYFFSKYLEIERELTFEEKTLVEISKQYEKGVKILNEGHFPKESEKRDLWIKEFWDWRDETRGQIELLSEADATMFYTLGNDIKEVRVDPKMDIIQVKHLGIFHEHIRRLRDYIKEERKRIKMKND